MLTRRLSVDSYEVGFRINVAPKHVYGNGCYKILLHVQYRNNYIQVEYY
jgi:hypothetical protein